MPNVLSPRDLHVVFRPGIGNKLYQHHGDLAKCCGRYNHCGESKTQRKWFLDEKSDGLVDENRANYKENKNNRAVFMLYLFAYNIKPMSK